MPLREPDLDHTSGGKRHGFLKQRLTRPRPPLAQRTRFFIGEMFMDTAKLVVRGVAKTYRTGKQLVEALSSIDLTVAQGEFVTMIGPSGCGKSTLFNIIAGVDEASEGHITLDGKTD